MHDEPHDPGYKLFGYVAVFVGMVMIIGNLVRSLHGSPPDWLSVGVGAVGIFCGFAWTRRKVR